MMSPVDFPVLLRRAAGHAWAITASYVIAGVLWLTGCSFFGPKHAEEFLGLAWLFCLVSGILVFLCGLVFCAIGSCLVPSAFEQRRDWRNGLAGILTAGTFYSGILERVMWSLKSWSAHLPFAETVVGAVLVFVTPFILGITLSCLASGLLPPWGKAKVPPGGSGEDILPPGASQIA